MAVVTTSASGVSYVSNVNDNGDFMVMGLPGTYADHTITHYCQ
jgi:hypothetical protein